MTVNPDKIPYPSSIILTALEQIKFNPKLSSAKDKVNKLTLIAIEKLIESKILPLERAKMRIHIEFELPAIKDQIMGKASEEFSEHFSVENESDRDCQLLIEPFMWRNLHNLSKTVGSDEMTMEILE